jgi:hypothetical protein
LWAVFVGVESRRTPILVQRENTLNEFRTRTGKLAPFPEKRFEEFLRHCKVQTKEYGLQPLSLLGTQRYIYEEIVKGLKEGASTFVILKARQLGSSTFFLALDLFWAFEHAGMSGAFATHEDKSAQKFRAIIETFFHYLPKQYKIRPSRHNRDILILQNGSMFSYMVAGTKQNQTRASSLGRSGAHTFLHATEVAYWGNEDDVSELKATMAQHNPHRLQIWESTANGFNHFEEMWRLALESPTQRAIFVGWWRNDLYSFDSDHPTHAMYVRDATMTALERQRVRAVKEEYGAEISFEQLAWYRWALETEQKGDQSSMDEKFPWLPDDAFQATGAKFFTSASLTAAMKTARRTTMMPFRYSLKQDWQETSLETLRDHKRAELKIYEEMHPDGVYALGCDPAYGSSDHNDKTAMCVLRCYADCAVQVAEYASNRVTTYECAWILAHLAGYYRQTRVNLEITGPGNAVSNEIQALRRYIQQDRRTLDGGTRLSNVLNLMSYFLYRRPDSLSGEFLLHTKTTSEIKEYLANSFRDSFTLGRLHLRSMYLLDEMKTIVREDSWIGGSGSKADDRFMAAVLAHSAWKQWEQPKLLKRGLTLEQALRSKDAPPGERKVQAMVLNYLRTAKIAVGAPPSPHMEPERQ